MFKVGEKIFYPLHGAGRIIGIEEKEILGEKESYYILDMTLKDLKVMIPVGKTASLEIREVVELDILDDALAMFQHAEQTIQDIPYLQRQRVNVDKMKSGDIFEGVEVILDLTTRNSKKKLGIADKSMLHNAKQMLISELVVVKEIDIDEATQLLRESSTTSM